jgi:hypothetical protein
MWQGQQGEIEPTMGIPSNVFYPRPKCADDRHGQRGSIEPKCRPRGAKAAVRRDPTSSQGQ